MSLRPLNDLFIVVFIIGNLNLSMARGCWWTGCQKSTWAVVGCGQYDLIEIATKVCDGGKEYQCCPPPMAPASADDTALATGCWWTGCQLSSWAVVGCGQYNMNEKAAQVCDGGKEYHCCPKNTMDKSSLLKISTIDESKSKQTQPELVAGSECWWTNCQNRDVDTGCSDFNQTELDSRKCYNGNRYYCCEPPSIKNSEAKEKDCWWSSCQGKSWKRRGCPSDTEEKSSKPCPDGDLYECCEIGSD